MSTSSTFIDPYQAPPTDANPEWLGGPAAVTRDVTAAQTPTEFQDPYQAPPSDAHPEWLGGPEAVTRDVTATGDGLLSASDALPGAAADADVEDDDSAVEEDDEAAMTVVSPLIPAAVTPKRSLAQAASAPKIVVPEHMRREVIERERVPTVRAARGEFELPGTDLLDEPSTEEVQQDPVVLEAYLGGVE